MTTVLMLIIKPLWLFDVGWQLSVGATAGLLFIHPRICTRPGLVQPFSVRKLSNLGNLFLIVLRRLWSFIAADFWVSVAALLATQPILLANFGNLSFLAPIVNALVLWTIGPLMVLGFLMALGGPVATILGWISYLLLTFFVAVTQVFGQLNWAVLEGWRLHWLFGLLYYFGLIYLFLRRKQTPHA